LKKTLIIIVPFLLGMICGSALMAQLFKNASAVYLEMIYSNHSNMLEKKGDDAYKQCQFAEAAGYYRSLLALPGIKSSMQKNNPWTFGFPLSAIVLKNISSAADPSGLGSRRLKGIYHGKLALSLEKSGNATEAKIEYQTAAKLMDAKDVELAKRTVTNILYDKRESPCRSGSK